MPVAPAATASGSTLVRQRRQAPGYFAVQPGPVDAIQRLAALRRIDQQFALYAAALEGGGIRQAAEGDHRVTRHEAVRMAFGQLPFQRALQQEVGVVDP